MTKKKIVKKPKTVKKNVAPPLDFSKIPNLPKEAKEKLEKIKGKVEIFQKQVLEKFDQYIMGITLLPPKKAMPMMPRPMPQGQPGMPPIGPGAVPQMPAQKGAQTPPADEINVMVLIDDSDSKKMSKFELKNKLHAIIAKIGKEVDPKLMADTVILSELWQNCYDAKYDLLRLIAMGAPTYDTGMLAAIKISEIHKQMVLKKFEKYIVSYVLAGSLVQGKARPESDIDVFVVIDDTDVKKMTRAELKDKLRAIIIGMGIEAGEMTGIKNKLNIQVYIMTDFWDNIKEANPIIFTFLRDGIPFYDRGIFMPWKQLLRMGKVKPSPEAIDIFMHSGDQMLSRIKFKLNAIGMEDTFYAILTPSQAAIMMYGVPPPTPKETPNLMREIFVKKEKLLEDKYVKILEKNIQVRKDVEHGTIKSLSGKEVDELLTNAEDYLKRIKKLFTQIEKVKEEESVLHMYEHLITVVRDVLRIEGIVEVKTSEIDAVFDKNIVAKGLIPQKFSRVLHETIKAKKDYDAGSLSKTDVSNVKKDTNQLIKVLIEHIQRKRGKELEKTKIRVKHGEKFGEVILLGKDAYIIHDIDNEEKELTRAQLTEEGGLKDYQKSNPDELEQALVQLKIPPKVFIKQKIFEDLKEIFGKDIEIQVSY